MRVFPLVVLACLSLGCLSLGGCAAPLLLSAGQQMMAAPPPACAAGAACPGTSVIGQMAQSAGDSLQKLTGLASAAPPTPSQP